eukprot:459130-Karenia_brevis.AAC.1
MAVQNNNWQNVENIFKVIQLTVQRAAERKYLGGPFVSSPQSIAKLFDLGKMRDMCYQPLQGWRNPNGSARSVVLVRDSTLNMVGKQSKQSAEFKWAECIKEMYGCSNKIIFLGGEGLAEM